METRLPHPTGSSSKSQSVVVIQPMRSTLLKVCLMFGIPLILAGCQHPGGISKKPASSGWVSGVAETRELDRLNQELTDAYEREDVATLRRMLSDAHIHNNVFGSRLTKDEFLKDIETGVLEFVSYKTPSIEWVRDGNLAIATGVIEAVAIRSGKRVPASRFRFTRIFIRESRRWKVLLFQNTMMQRIPGTKAE